MVGALDMGSLFAKAVLSVVITGVIGFVWLRSSNAMADWINLRRGEMGGKWFGLLLKVGDAPERIDAYRVRQRGQRLVGHIERMRPSGRKGKWRMVGYVHGNVVVCLFYTKTPGNDPSSYGVICLHRAPEYGDDGVYRGYYTRPEFEPFDRFVDGSIATRPIVWQRTHPDVKRFDK